MLETLKKLNTDIPMHSVLDEAFRPYGRVIELDTSDLCRACEGIDMPKEGASYEPSIAALENTESAKALEEALYGGLEAQTGLCWGYNSSLDALEYHGCSEINVAVKPVVLFLGLRQEIEGDTYKADKLKAFYVPKGVAVELYATTLHYCPCQTGDDGFYCVVVLPKDTNTPLEGETADKLLFQKNKWLLCHGEKEDLVKDGVHAGITGKNYTIQYK